MLLKIFFFCFLCITQASANERIITLSPAINEIVFALGKGNLIVANTDHARYPKKSIQIPKVGGYFGVSLEKLLSFQPTLVLLQKNNAALARKLKRYHIETLTFSISSLESIKEMIFTIGKRLDALKKAHTIIVHINKELNLLKHPIRHKSILFIFGASGDLKRPMYCAGKDLYFDELIHIAGYQNAVDFPKTESIGLEKLLSINPDIIIIADSSIKNKQKNNVIQRWQHLPLKAVKNNQVYILNKVYQTMPSDRISLFIHDLINVLP